MITRIWRGWTTPSDAEAYEVLLRWFDSIEAVRVFAGENHEIAVVPGAARELLARFDERSRHYETRLEPSK